MNSFADAQREVNRQNSLHPDQLLVVLDLGTVAQEKDLASSAQAMVSARPWMTVILLSPLLDPKAEIEAVQELRVIQYCRMIRPDEITNVGTWKQFLRETFVEHTAADIQADRLAAEMALRKDRGMLNVPGLSLDDHCLRDLLRLAPGVPNAGALAKQTKLARSTLCEKFKRLGHTPSDFIILFRALWTKRLRAIGRTPAQVASFFGCRDADQHRLILTQWLKLVEDFPRPIPPATSTDWGVLGWFSGDISRFRGYPRVFHQEAAGVR